jgi:hypothetical protein
VRLHVCNLYGEGRGWCMVQANRKSEQSDTSFHQRYMDSHSPCSLKPKETQHVPPKRRPHCPHLHGTKIQENNQINSHSLYLLHIFYEIFLRVYLNPGHKCRLIFIMEGFKPDSGPGRGWQVTFRTASLQPIWQADRWPNERRDTQEVPGFILSTVRSWNMCDNCHGDQSDRILQLRLNWLKYGACFGGVGWGGCGELWTGRRKKLKKIGEDWSYCCLYFGTCLCRGFYSMY